MSAFEHVFLGVVAILIASLIKAVVIRIPIKWLEQPAQWLIKHDSMINKISIILVAIFMVISLHLMGRFLELHISTIKVLSDRANVLTKKIEMLEKNQQHILSDRDNTQTEQ